MLNGMLRFNDEAARKLEAIYTTPDIVAQRRETLDHLRLRPGEFVIDIGCGPGFLAEEIADAVGATGFVLAIDISDDVLRLADQRRHPRWLAYLRADAGCLCVADLSFDVAVSAQALEYVEDPDRALSEMYRVVKHGGRALVMNTDWDRVAWYSDDPVRMAKVRKAWEAHCIDPHLPRTLIRRLHQVGFKIQSAPTFSIINTRASPDNFSHGLIDLMVTFIAQQGTVSLEELDAWAAELHALSSAGRYFFSNTRSFFCATKPVPAPSAAPRA
jgi:ubiquinone/menaquinone biosynthesis C-methylase UbiE